MNNKKFIFSDGKELDSEELIKFYKNNLRSNKVPVAGYFCPLCHHEIPDIIGNPVCKHYNYINKGKLKNALYKTK